MSEGKREKLSVTRRKNRSAWGLVPLALLFAVVGALPFFSALKDSFFHDFFGERSFAGFDNYSYILGDRAFAMSAGITLAWSVASTLLSVVLGYSLAALLFEARRGFRILYSILLVPWGVPAFIAVPVWRMLIHGAGGDSLLYFLFGIRVNLLTDPAASFAAALFVDAWLNVPAAVFVIYGALRKIPKGTIEAARIDGAGAGILSARVYFPQVAGSLLAVAALGFVKALKEFNVPFLLTAGGPPLLSGITGRTVVGATTTLEVYLYDLFRASDDYGIPAAYAAVLAAAILCIVAAAVALRFAFARSARSGSIGGPAKSRLSPRAFPAAALSALAGRFRDLVLQSFRLALAGLVALSSALAVYAVLWLSFSGLSSTYIDAAIPRFFTADNFRLIFAEDGLGRAFLNTLGVSAVSAFLISFFVLPAAFRLRSFSAGRKAGIFAGIQALGAAGGMHSLIPLYVLFRSLGLLESYIPIVIVYLFHAAPFSLFTTSAFLEKLPSGLEEAAELEGASAFTRFFRIVLPLAMPAVATSAMIAFLAAWNGFLVPLLFLGDDSMYTIGVKLHSYVGSVASGSPAWNRFAAASIVNLAIVGILFLRFRSPLSANYMAEHDE